MNGRRASGVETAETAPASGAGELGHARVAFRDRPMLDVLDLALRFVVVHHRRYLQIAAATLLPAVGLSLLAAWAWDWGVAWAFAIGFFFVAQIPFTVLASRLVFHDRVAARDVLARSARDLPRLVMVRVLSLAALAVGTMCAVVPGAWLGAVLFFMDEVLLLERAPAWQAFDRSKRLTANALGDVLLAGGLLVLVPALATLLAEVGGHVLMSELLQIRPPPWAYRAGGSWLCVVGLVASAPFVATARFFTYLNVRTRVEGWDIQTRFAAIANRPDDEGREAAA